MIEPKVQPSSARTPLPTNGAAYSSTQAFAAFARHTIRTKPNHSEVNRTIPNKKFYHPIGVYPQLSAVTCSYLHLIFHDSTETHLDRGLTPCPKIKPGQPSQGQSNPVKVVFSRFSACEVTAKSLLKPRDFSHRLAAIRTI
jgi:hypothetical protein